MSPRPSCPGKTVVVHHVVSKDAAYADQQAGTSDLDPLHDRAGEHDRCHDEEDVRAGLTSEAQTPLGHEDLSSPAMWLSGRMTSGVERRTLDGTPSDESSDFDKSGRRARVDACRRSPAEVSPTPRPERSDRWRKLRLSNGCTTGPSATCSAPDTNVRFLCAATRAEVSARFPKKQSIR